MRRLLQLRSGYVLISFKRTRGEAAEGETRVRISKIEIIGKKRMNRKINARNNPQAALATALRNRGVMTCSLVSKTWPYGFEPAV